MPDQFVAVVTASLPLRISLTLDQVDAAGTAEPHRLGLRCVGPRDEQTVRPIPIRDGTGSQAAAVPGT